jgi:exodeoxyribonuclease-3
VLVVTWNVNSLRARLPRLLELLNKHAPDVVCLQETKCQPDGFPVAELADTGYTAVHHSAGQWNGVALLARAGLELEDVVIGLPGDPAPEEARWIEAIVAGLRVVSTYVPNGRTLDSPEYPRKLAFLKAAAQRAAAVDLIAGDFNVAPADIDVYDPALFVGGTHVTTEERALVQAFGKVDAFRHLHPETVGFTWWDYRAGNFHKGLGLRIDLVLVSDLLAQRLLACGIDRDFRKGVKPSDHAPLLAQFANA